MRIAILTDTHFGARNDSQQFLDYFLDFINNQFLPECTRQNVSAILHLGDLFDRRKFINYSTLNQVRERFIGKVQDMNLPMYCLIGNHDTYYKNTNEVNSLQELFDQRYDCFHVISKPTELTFGSKTIALVPWINKQNEKECFDFIDNTKSSILCGHFEISGYEVMRGVKFDGGMNDDRIRRFDKVWSGHFHVRHTKNNVRYMGTPYQITFSDLYESKGFYIYDTETDELSFIENEDKMFLHIDYTDDLVIDDLSKYENKYIKLFVRDKKSQATLDTFVDRLYDAKIGSLTVVEEDNMSIKDSEVADMSLDTLSLIQKEAEDFYATIEGVDIHKLKRLIQDIYMEALSQ